MRRLTGRGLPVIAAALWAAGATLAGGRDHDDARALREQGAVVPLEQILRAANAHRPGRVVDVELERKNHRYVYEIELLDASGEVWELKFDARTGAMLQAEPER
jgi:uncharacterized membrane protein YkoI